MVQADRGRARGQDRTRSDRSIKSWWAMRGAAAARAGITRKTLHRCMVRGCARPGGPHRAFFLAGRPAALRENRDALLNVVRGHRAATSCREIRWSACRKERKRDALTGLIEMFDAEPPIEQVGDASEDSGRRQADA